MTRAEKAQSRATAALLLVLSSSCSAPEPRALGIAVNWQLYSSSRASVVGSCDDPDGEVAFSAIPPDAPTFVLEGFGGSDTLSFDVDDVVATARGKTRGGEDLFVMLRLGANNVIYVRALASGPERSCTFRTPTPRSAGAPDAG